MSGDQVLLLHCLPNGQYGTSYVNKADVPAGTPQIVIGSDGLVQQKQVEKNMEQTVILMKLKTHHLMSLSDQLLAYILVFVPFELLKAISKQRRSCFIASTTFKQVYLNYFYKFASCLDYFGHETVRRELVTKPLLVCRDTQLTGWDKFTAELSNRSASCLAIASKQNEGLDIRFIIGFHTGEEMKHT